MFHSRNFSRLRLAPFRGRFGLMVVLVALLLGWRAWPLIRPILELQTLSSGRLHVGDGDSLDLDGVRYRLAGIDAPETDQTCTLAGERHPCGREAREHLVGLIAGRAVSCAWSKLDKYHRRLGRCRAGDTDLNAAMVRGGWAVAYGGYESEEADARAHGRGVWSGDFVWPEDFRREKRDPSGASSSGFGDWLQGWWR